MQTPAVKLADHQWFSSYNSISPEFSLFRYNSTPMQFSVITIESVGQKRTRQKGGAVKPEIPSNSRNPIFMRLEDIANRVFVYIHEHRLRMERKKRLDDLRENDN